MLIDKVIKTIRSHQMIAHGDVVLVALSGGPDSVCLLSALHALSDKLGIRLHAAHIDHMFRGRESAEEARFAAETAGRLGVPITVETIDVPTFCRERGISAQAGAREIRYAFLSRTAERVGATRIALGHTASDQAETLLMRLVRGAGTSGLSGIPPVRGVIIRPLIDVTRDEVLAYLAQNGLKYAIDSSNAKPIYTRNRIRLELIPALSRFNPSIVQTLAEEAAILRDDDEALEACISAHIPSVMEKHAESIRIRRDAFNSLLPALRRRILRKAIESAAGNRAVSFDKIEEALGFISSAQTGRVMSLAAGLAMEREYENILIRPAPEPQGFCIMLHVPGVTEAAEINVKVETRIITPGQAIAETDEKSVWQAVFDYDKIVLPLYIRSRRPGDRFCPAGMGGKGKKLQDFLTDEKVPRRLRSLLPILATEKDIVWVVGMRTDMRFLPDDKSGRLLVITVSGEGLRANKT